MNAWLNAVKRVLLACLIGILPLAAGGCEGTETRETVDDTVETVAGEKDLQHYRQMKEGLDDIQKRQTDRYRRLDAEERGE